MSQFNLMEAVRLGLEHFYRQDVSLRTEQMVDEIADFFEWQELGVLDGRVADAMRRVPRIEFVPDVDGEDLNDAYLFSCRFPLNQDYRVWRSELEFLRENLVRVRGRRFQSGEAQTMAREMAAREGVFFTTPPLHVAVNAQMVLGGGWHKDKKVVEIGGGSGYQAAVLAQIFGDVVSCEIDPDIAEMERENLGRAGVRNVRVVNDNGFDWVFSRRKRFDAIVVSGALSDDRLFVRLGEKLGVGGRMVVPFVTLQSTEIVNLGRERIPILREEVDLVKVERTGKRNFSQQVVLEGECYDLLKV